jgi:23S rRNA-/tRNA-specific pseudouridylate synthase
MTRLDYMVQGICLFAKHKDAEKSLFKLTQERGITKHYLALLPKHDTLPQKEIVTLPLLFTDKARVDATGKKAKTLFIHHRDISEGISVYMVKLFTGRRHQIRAHAAKKLLPLLGDGMYGSRCKHLHRHIGLIAYKYVFTCFGRSYRIQLQNPLDRLDTDGWRIR